jgi:protein phosphatase-4 regulatory subunit 3
MASADAAQANEKKRVKVYELRNNDWFDRGTGFCTGQVINVRILDLATASRSVGGFCEAMADARVLRP